MSWAFISWQSIIAGAVTALAVSIVMGILGVALGFTVVKPSKDEPTSGLGVAFGVWGVISVIVSLAAGGYVSGVFAGTAGAVHGFMVWATVLLAGLFVGGAAIGGAVRTIGSAVKTVGSGAASVVSTVGQSVGHGVSSLASSAVDHIQKSVNLDFEPGDIGDKVASVLRDTGVDTLQPDYLRGQIRELKQDIKSSLYKLRLDSDTYNKVMDEFLGKEKNRLSKITDSLDKDAAVTALMNKRGISRDEAQQEFDNALKVYNRTIQKAQDTVADAQNYVNETVQHMQDATQRARLRADDMARTAAKSALAAALALLIGAVICVYAGRYGDKHSERYGVWTADRATVIQIPMEEVQARR